MKMVQRCIRLTRLTLVCEVIRYRLVKVQQNLKERLFGLATRNRLSLSLPLSFSSSSYFLSFSKQKLNYAGYTKSNRQIVCICYLLQVWQWITSLISRLQLSYSTSSLTWVVPPPWTSFFSLSNQRAQIAQDSLPCCSDISRAAPHVGHVWKEEKTQKVNKLNAAPTCVEHKIQKY